MLKADGLAAGKGVLIIDDVNEANQFIVCWVSDCCSNETKKVICIGSRKLPCPSHKALFEWFKRTFSNGFQSKCLGGGEIKINTNDKLVNINGSSINYGKEPDRSDTLDILRKTFPDFNVS